VSDFSQRSGQSCNMRGSDVPSPDESDTAQAIVHKGTGILKCLTAGEASAALHAMQWSSQSPALSQTQPDEYL